MRFYSFTNFYLNSISQGIQPAHAMARMFVKYTDECPQKSTLFDWAANHETIICLNGGNAAGIREIWETIQRLGSALNLPFQKFHEDVQSLDGTMTSVAIIVPTHIYEAAAEIREQGANTETFIRMKGFSAEELELMTLLNSFSFAK